MKQKGFTLLELIIALGILSTALLALLSLSITVLKVNKHSQNHTAALQLAQEKMESLKALPFDELKGENENGLTTGTVQTLFQRETIIQRQDASGLAEITVRVLWPSWIHPGRPQVLEMFTRVAG
jgi:type II secretion system protein I